MTINHLKKDPSKTISWASGISAEIFIYPSTGDFQTRDFLFRISTATVEAEETVFTSFPNITRTLMVLEGNLTLVHADRYTKSMAPFEQDTFQGDWDTKSQGIVTDFNLMCKHGASGTVKNVSVESGSEVTCNLKADYELIYLASGNATYEGNQLESGDCLVIADGQDKQIELAANEHCNFIQTSVNLKL